MFLAVGFVNIPKDERFKLDDKAKHCIFLGYGYEEFGHRLWNPVDKKLVRSRVVMFLEDQTATDFEKGLQLESHSAPKSINGDDVIDLNPIFSTTEQPYENGI